MKRTKGSAMLITVAFVLVTLAGLSIFHRQVRTIINVSLKETFLDSENPNAVRIGLGKALALMETGEPPSPYTCKLQTMSASLIFVNNISDWSVSSSTDSADMAVSTCACPSTFAGTPSFYGDCQ